MSKMQHTPPLRLSWQEARDNGLLWYVNSLLQHVGLSIYLEGAYDADTDTFREEPTCYMGTNPCRGFVDDEEPRAAFSRWLADNAEAMHNAAFPSQVEEHGQDEGI